MIPEPENQLDLFDGPHVPRVRAWSALCACDPGAALRSLEHEGPGAAPLRALASALSEALESVARHASDPAPETRRRWRDVEALARQLGGLRGRDLDRLRRSFHARVLDPLPRPLPLLWPDGTPSAWLMLRAGDAAGALSSVYDALRVAPRSAAVLLSFANALRATDRQSLAADAYRDALYLEPGAVEWEDVDDPALRRFLEEDDGAPPWRLPRAVLERVLPLPAPGAVILEERAADAFERLVAGDPASLGPVERARILYLGMALGAPGPAVGADLGRIRGAMKSANPELFESYMERLRER